MKTVKADLHIHTVLSPCGDLDMSPCMIVEKAEAQNLEIIGITDHNSTRQIAVVVELASERNILVMRGMEITTREEIHCLAFFPDQLTCDIFQQYIDEHQPFISNSEGIFGYQVIVDAEETIIGMEEKLLITASNKGINEIEKEVHHLGGIFIPAHIDRPVNSIFSQLGFIPPGLQFEALEMTCFTTEKAVREKFHLTENIKLIRNSDAHFPQDIGKGFSYLTLERLTFEEVRMALSGRDGRYAIPC